MKASLQLPNLDLICSRLDLLLKYLCCICGIVLENELKLERKNSSK